MRLPALSLAVAFIAISETGLRAAEIDWGPATNISGDSDVSLNGTLISAVNPGQNGANLNGVATTVNGVTFTAFAPNGSGTPTDSSGRFTLAAATGYGVYTTGGLGSGATPFSSLSAAYRQLLDFADYASNSGQTDFSGSLTMTINGLMIGNQYEFQFWFNDSRPFSTGPMTATTGNKSVSLDPNTTDAAGGLGQFAIGTFTADATTQVIVFSTTGNAVGHSGYQLRQIPEPSAGRLATAGMLATAVRKKRRPCA